MPTVRNKVKAALAAIGAGITYNGAVAGINSIYDEARQTRRDLDFGNNNFNCTAAYLHGRLEAKVSFFLYLSILVVMFIPFYGYFLLKVFGKQQPSTEQHPRIEEESHQTSSSRNYGAISETTTTTSNQEFHANRPIGCTPKGIIKFLLSILCGGLPLNGIYSGIRYAYEYAQPTQDFTDNPPNCIASYHDERWDIRRDFAIYWALFGVGAFFTALFLVAEAVSVRPRVEEEASLVRHDQEQIVYSP